MTVDIVHGRHCICHRCNHGKTVVRAHGAGTYSAVPPARVLAATPDSTWQLLMDRRVTRLST
jgi:hypothetical protein